MIRKCFLAAVAALAAGCFVYGQRYCNPLPMPIGPGGNASGDVTVIQEGGKYYMYCTGGGAWVSEDLLNWDFHRVEGVPVAPDIVKYDGKFYLSGNNDNLFTRILSAPGLAMQRITTREPDDSMIEIAIAAMKPCIPADKSEDKW